VSTVIIGGGGAVRNAVTNMENQSVNWTTAQRTNAENLLKDVADQIKQFTTHPQPPA
jgi:hypothetical protein